MSPDVSLDPSALDAPAFRALSAAVEQAAEAIMVTDARADLPGPEILYVNRAHGRTFGYGRDEVIGQTPRMFQGPKTDRGVLDRIRRRIEAGEPAQVEAVNYRKDGSEFVLQWEIAPVRDEGGVVTHWVGTQRDVTEQRRLEDEVLTASAREQERMARELHDGLGQVLTGAAMQLQVLETLIGRGDLDAAALAARAGRAHELVAGAHEQARAIARGLSPLAIEPDGLDAALARFAADAEAALGVDCTVEAEVHVVLGSAEEAGHLYRIVQEAVTNAVRHGRAGRVAVGLADAGGGAVALTVRDDGAGIADEALEGGGGLGLRTMAYRARRVGGALDVRRLEGGGTAVRVRFSPRRPGGAAGDGAAGASPV
ncbi:PAS domain S-box protein [Rubrivirga sp. S365]|uniref:PAS domain-containing sensor histidine kinase n=1 Tax=Rubrivirga sp. S365 TaxID=3076080 RepID=UPI0028CA62DF|nr:PAS domain S-box protein [Rubrivirga sp. S365]MDT7856359.1 PAS domain S-box protein [Rubrivirga sp. S365]